MRFFLVAAVSALLAAPALASSSAWIETEGGRVRLITAGLADKGGRLRGALQIELKPGWKTYWRDPGDAGVPPSLEVSGSLNVAGAEIGFPAPKWFDDGYSVWAGYDRPVALPVTFLIPEPDRFSMIEADVFLGVCETICIPVQAELTVEAGADPNNAEDRAVVSAAFDALPEPASEEFGVTATRIEGDTLIATAAAANPEKTVLFLAGAGGWAFGVPRVAKPGTFEAEILNRPEGDAPADIGYTLTGPAGAVSGSFRLPAG